MCLTALQLVVNKHRLKLVFTLIGSAQLNGLRYIGRSLDLRNLRLQIARQSQRRGGFRHDDQHFVVGLFRNRNAFRDESESSVDCERDCDRNLHLEASPFALFALYHSSTLHLPQNLL